MNAYHLTLGLVTACAFCVSCQESSQKIAVLAGHSSVINSVAFLPTRDQVVSAGADRTIRIWDIRSGRELRKITGHTNNIINIAAAPDGKTLLSGGQDGTFRLWDITSGDEVRRFDALDKAVSPIVAISPDGGLAATTDFEMGQGAVIRLWTLTKLTEVRRLKASINGWMEAPSFSRDGRRLAASCTSNDSAKVPDAVIIWDLESGRELRRIHLPPGAPGDVDFSPDGRQLLGGVPDGIVLWDVETGTELKRAHIRTPGSMGIGTVKFSPDGRYFLAAGPKTLATLWDAKTFTKLETFDGNGAVAFSPRGDYVAMARNDYNSYTVRVWQLKFGS